MEVERLARELDSPVENDISVNFTLEEAQCIGCAICADVCDKNALNFEFQGFLPKWNRMLCDGCSTCRRQCPTGAIEVEIERMGTTRRDSG